MVSQGGALLCDPNTVGSVFSDSHGQLIWTLLPAPSPQVQSDSRFFLFAILIESLYPRPSTPPASTLSQTESVVSSLYRTQLSPIDESCTSSPTVPSPPAFSRTPKGGPSPSTSTVETLSTHFGAITSPSNTPHNLGCDQNWVHPAIKHGWS